MFEGVEVFQEEQPRGLLGVVEFAGATGVFPEDVVNVFEGLFEHWELGEPIVRSWWIGCVCVVFVRDHSPDTIPPHGGQMLLKRGCNGE